MTVLTASLGETLSKPFVDLWDKIVELGPKWLVALFIILLAWLLAKVIRRLMQKIVGRVSTQGHIHILVSRGAAALVLAVGVILALTALGMNLSAALAAIGLASVGLGFALQDILGNLFAGVILLIQHPFTIGDQVRLGDEEGVVENVRVRDTQILTYEGERVYVPNKTVFNNPIINFTSTPSLRVDVRIGIRYEEDISVAKRITGEIMAGTKGILNNPEPVVLVESEAEAAVLVLRFWMDSDRNRRLRVQSDVLEWVIGRFKAEGITIPYPIRTVEFHKPHDGPREDEAGKTRAMQAIPDEDEGGRKS